MFLQFSRIFSLSFFAIAKFHMIYDTQTNDKSLKPDDSFLSMYRQMKMEFLNEQKKQYTYLKEGESESWIEG